MAQAIVRFLAQQYVERDGQEQRFIAGMFGIFGHGNVSGLGQALSEFRREMPYYQSRNEQAQVHSAAAYAKMKNRLQILACTSSVGPGATNMVTGAATATVNRLPVLLLPGDTFASRLPHPVLQQLEFAGGQDVSVNDAFRPVSKYFDRITRPAQLLSSLPEAMRVLTSQAECGAVTIALPEDVQTEAYDYPAVFLDRRVHHVDRQAPAATALARAVDRIARARRPLIVAGGGAIYSDASSSIDEFAGKCGIPVAETQAGKGTLPWNHPWNTGPIGATGGLAANRLAARADLVIAVGTRLTDFTTASKTAFQNPDVTFVTVNVSPMDAGKHSALALVGDARVTVDLLANALSAAGYRTSQEYADEVHALQREWNSAVDAQLDCSGRAQESTGYSKQPRDMQDEAGSRIPLLTQAQVIGIVNTYAGSRGVVVCAAGGMPGDLHKLWRATDPKGYHLEYGYSCMGYEIAGGHGVKMADPSREVYVMVGDGSYLMLHTEIVTSLQEGNKLTIVLVDNGGFQCIRSLQQSLGSAPFGNEFRYRDRESELLDGPYMPVDFVKNAESLGAAAYRASNVETLKQALEAAASESRTVLIHVTVDVDARVPGYQSWWDVPVAEVSGQPDVSRARLEYDASRQRQRYF